MFPVQTKQIRKSADSSNVRSKLTLHCRADSTPQHGQFVAAEPGVGPSPQDPGPARNTVLVTLEDAMTLEALQMQHRELGIVLAQLESARAQLMLPPPESWLGAARHAYESAFDGIVMTMEAGLAAVRSARERTATAIAWMPHGG